MFSQPGANKPLKPKSVKGRNKVRQTHLLLIRSRLLLFAHDSGHLGAKGHPTHLSGPSAYLLPTTFYHLLIWRCTKARREILEILQFYPHRCRHHIVSEFKLQIFHEKITQLLLLLLTIISPWIWFSLFDFQVLSHTGYLLDFELCVSQFMVIRTSSRFMFSGYLPKFIPTICAGFFYTTRRIR